jgi:hypothetical protein
MGQRTSGGLSGALAADHKERSGKASRRAALIPSGTSSALMSTHGRASTAVSSHDMVSVP